MTIVFESKYPLKTWKVKSRSKEGDFYLVELWGDGKLCCNCPSGMYRNWCKHRSEKRNELEAVYGGIPEAIINFEEEKALENEK